MPGAGIIGGADLAAIKQDLESNDIGFLCAVEIPAKAGQCLFLRLVEREVADDFRRMGYIGGFGFLFFRLHLETSGCYLLHPQGRWVGIAGSLHIGQEQGRLLERGPEGGIVPGLGHGLGGGTDFELHFTEGPLARLPGEVVDGFVDMGVGVLLLLPEIVGEVGKSDVLDPAADGVGLVGRGNRGQDHRNFYKFCCIG